MGMINRNGVWYTDDWMGGRRIRRSLGKSKKEAEKLYAEFRETIRAKRLGIVPQNVTLEYFKDQYFAFLKSERSLKTQSVTRLAFERLREARPIKYIYDITPQFLTWCKSEWKEKYSQCSIGCYLVAIKTAMRKAEEWRYLAPQPWQSIKTHKPQPRVEYFTPEELEDVLRFCYGPYYTAALLMARMGLRSGEVRHLQWEDISFERKSVWIHQKPCDICPECKHAGGIWKVKGTKPGHPPKQRYINMPPDVETYLKTIAKPHGYVLGKLFRPANYWHWFRDTLARRTAMKTNPHKFRHTFGAHLASAGVSLEKIGELMGHSDPKTTKIYAHLMPSALRGAIDSLPVLGSGLVLPLASSKRLSKTERESMRRLQEPTKSTLDGEIAHPR